MQSYAYVADKRLDHHFKLAHDLCQMYFEDLNLRGMKALGRKVSDLGFGKFMVALAWVALKSGKDVIKIDRFTPTTQLFQAVANATC